MWNLMSILVSDAAMLSFTLMVPVAHLGNILII